ncbi:MAG: hypothetical protein ACK59M_14150 [Pseudomonadota bacterium]|jgi:hypothetical protein|nr:hypothetical protein [Xanthomonadaceae bacterium]
MNRELAAFVDAWRVAGPALEALRDRELLETPLPKAMAQLEGMFVSAIHLEPLEPTSGLVEMQAIFARMRTCTR